MAVSKSPGLSAVEGDLADWTWLIGLGSGLSWQGLPSDPVDLTSVPRTHTTKPGVVTLVSL